MLRLGLSLLLLLLLLWRPSAAVGESSMFLPTPQNLTIQSYNFENVLRWSPVKGVKGTVSYRVEHRSLSDEHWKKVNCTDIAMPECNFDHGKDFYRIILRVRAEQGGLKSNWSQAGPFQAKKGTILGPPRAINVTSEANSLILRFLPPFEHRGESFPFHYVIYFWEESVSTKNSVETKNTEKKFKGLKEMTVYCFRVQARYGENTGKISDPHCLKTSATETTKIVYVTLIFGFAVFTIFVIFLCLWVIRKYKNTIKTFWQPPLRIPSHYEEDLQNAQMGMEHTFQNSAGEEHWDAVSITSNKVKAEF